ncbi:MAG TPA: response regulator [Gemmatimonadaceae bacterium]|nr:response regulator [Gemmatimonadaceae bacterium]
MSAPAARVLLAEDEEHLGTILEGFLQARGHRVHRVTDGRAALDALRAADFDVALLDVMMPELDGLDVLRGLAALDDAPEAIVMTGNGTADVAVTALQLGAYDHLPKPYRMAEVDLVVRRAAEKRRLRREVAALRARLDAVPADDVAVTRHPPLVAALAAARRATPGVPIVLQGEPGSGRCGLARWLHAQSGRGPDALREVRCAGDARRDAAVLLGAGDGTADALAARIAANGALAALDGISVLVHDAHRLTPAVRAAVLERLRTTDAAPDDGPPRPRCYLTVASDPDVVVAWPGVRVVVPPLRDRVVDVRPLAEHLLRDGARRQATTPPVLDDDAVAWLERQPWPGNVAELRLVLELALLRARDGRLTGAVLERSAAPAVHHPPLPTTA